MRLSGIVILLLTLLACEKDDPLLPGRFLTDQIGQADLFSRNGVDYQRQLYYDLSSNQVVRSNQRDAWDVAIGCNLDDPNLYVNPATNLAVAATGSTDFYGSYSPSDYAFRFERAERFFERGWIAEDFVGGAAGQEVFILNLGRSLNNQRRGFKLLQVLSIEPDAYNLRIANLDHSDLQEVRVEVDSRYNFVYLSLERPDSTMLLEPPREEWDLYFSRYMERLYDGSDTLDYSVTGCLINPFNTTAYYDQESSEDSTISYASLRLEDVVESMLTDRQNVIGHDWKYFDLDAGSYQMESQKNYFVRDGNNVTYRLRFTGFYSNDGRKGAISFEYLPL